MFGSQARLIRIMCELEEPKARMARSARSARKWGLDFWAWRPNRSYLAQERLHAESVDNIVGA